MLTYLAASLILCAYTWVGYPLLIGLLAFVRPLKAPQTRGWQPSVSACVAVHNGERYIKAKLESLLSQLYPADRIEVLVYADGCTDGTETVVAEMAASDPRVRLLPGARRSGKPTALNHMRLEARGEVLVMTDVRQPLAPETFGALVAALGPESVGCVSGNLVLEGDTGASFYWRYENWIRHAEARFRSMVGVTGPIYAVRRRDVPELPEDTILDDMWIPMRLRLAGKLLLFAPEAQARDDAFGDEREFSRKARTLAGNYQLFWRLPRLMLPFANPSWFETVSHKLLRLVCPWSLLSLPFATMGALFEAGDQAGVLRWTLMSFGAVQGLFLATAALGSRAFRPGVLARSFVVLNAAAIAGLWRFLTGRQRITW
jgi:poly-beta-1,6-N-acetyl-D-glucosamine synthase